MNLVISQDLDKHEKIILFPERADAQMDQFLNFIINKKTTLKILLQ